MNFQRQVSSMLHEAHLAMMGLLGNLEKALARAPRFDPALSGLASQFARALEQDVDRHFNFEEESLFPRMAENGDGDMAALLIEEHGAIREVSAEVLPLARAAGAGTIDEAGWSALRRNSMELIERQVAHIQKETMALLPLLDDLLDDETDRELAFAYSAG
jgi:hemerythrin-like domain-containing protein